MQIDEHERLAIVEAPTALKGFLLAQRLPRYRCRNTQGDDGRWRVSVGLVDRESLPGLLDVVQRWLWREQIEATQVRVGEQVHNLTARQVGPPSEATVGVSRTGQGEP